MKTTFTITIALFLLFSCSQVEHENNELTQLFHKEKELLCSLNQMKEDIAGEWDNVTTMLNNQLPADMPAEEKNNMLKVRNASLIRMFESYESMDDDIKQTITATEEHDQKMGTEIIELKNELKTVEKERMILLEKVHSKENVKQYADYLDLREEIINKNCP